MRKLINSILLILTLVLVSCSSYGQVVRVEVCNPHVQGRVVIVDERARVRCSPYEPAYIRSHSHHHPAHRPLFVGSPTYETWKRNGQLPIHQDRIPQQPRPDRQMRPVPQPKHPNDRGHFGGHRH